MKVYPKLAKTIKSPWIFRLLFCLLVERKVDQCKYNGAAMLALKTEMEMQNFASLSLEKKAFFFIW